ncbi:MAG TPA: hypothetical protein VHN77_11420 [Phycisphaerales bacterium]|nr:hypothetical protein [Phycisphaerales bacterium]
MKRYRLRGPVFGWMVAAITGGVAVLGGMTPRALAAPAPQASSDEATDTLLMTNGQELKGTVLAETPTTIKFRLSIAGITTDVEYPRSQIKEVRKGKVGGAPAVPESPKADDVAAIATDTSTPEPEASTPGDIVPLDGRTRYYYAELRGEFGADISETPIRNLMRDARKQKADVVIFFLDANWSIDGGLQKIDKSLDTQGEITSIFRAEKITPIFSTEVPAEWDTPPKVVFWVKTAMGGAAFLPMISENIYMHPEGRIGGLGNLSQLFEGTGDRVVHEKLRAAYLNHAKGWANIGRWDLRIIDAMTRIEYVLSARSDGTLFTDYPQNPSDELLTDSGEKDRQDTMEEFVRGTGNDVLTLDERKARLVGVSKGTVDSRDNLLYTLGLSTNAVPVGVKADRITKAWMDGLERAKDRMVAIMDEYRNVRVEQPGEYQQRTAARGKQRRLLAELKGLYSRWGEGLTRDFLQGSGLPGGDWITLTDEKIKIDQMMDKR